ncbi:uncharacterized protein LOC143225594 [Tachypleus tridentatus]|uniref:uncharacterized protein LOC143225594 n=1 Tax=Tachypleus tridentatus TaxID=6853 RepID=UPI003FD045C9
MEKIWISLAVVSVLMVSALANELVEDSDDEAVYRVIRSARLGRDTGVCKYRKSSWENCDTSTNTQRRTLTLKRGDPTLCEQTKIVTRNCKKACRYQKGDWSPCDAASNVRTRSDSLKPSSDASCEQTRVITKKCRRRCRYDRTVAWSDCDPVTNQKTKVKSLVEGDSSECEATQTVTKPCGRGRAGGNRRNRNRDEDEDYEE